VRVGTGEHRPHVGGVLTGERVEAAAGVAELAGECGERVRGVDGAAGGDDGQREGQVRAPGDDLVRGVGLHADAVVAEPVGQQQPSLVVGEQAQRERVGAIGGDQAGELVAAGDQDQAAGGAGQQGADLVGVAGVVQQHQHALARQQAAVQTHSRLRADRDSLGRDLQRVQKPPDRFGGFRRMTRRVEAAQVGIELAVGEQVGHPVGPVHRERGLADAGRAGDRGDHYRPPRSMPVAEQAVQRLQLRVPPDEPVDAGGKLPRHHPAGQGRSHAAGQLRCASEQVGVDLLQLWARVGAQLLGEARPDLLVPCQRLGWAARPLQDSEQTRPQGLPQWEPRGQLPQLRC
jgi:hypothetical protein